jgi:hypothetical protein
LNWKNAGPVKKRAKKEGLPGFNPEQPLFLRSDHYFKIKAACFLKHPAMAEVTAISGYKLLIGAERLPMR